MRSYRLLFSCLLLLPFSVFAQQPNVSGKVVNDRNEPIAGASIQITGGGGVATNMEGVFNLFLTPGKYELTVSAVGYVAKTLTEINVTTDKTELNIALQSASKDLGNIVISASRSTARKETINALLQFQKNTNTVASVISAEAIRRSPDRNTGEVLKRTSGASIQDGKYIVIRGLADRYNQAMLNGILLTSTEPDRKTFSFDLIPASMIDNIIINKAFVPEYPGEWAGGLIQVTTRDIPSTNYFNIQLGTGFNSQTIGRTFYKSRGGKLDWVGIDDGTRGLPSSYTTKSNFDILSAAEKTAIGMQMSNDWTPIKTQAPLNISFQANGGFVSKIFGKTFGGTLGFNYNRSNRFLDLLNKSNSLSQGIFSTNYSYDDNRYGQDVAAGAVGSFSLQLNSLNRVTLKSLINLNSSNSVTQRQGSDFNRGEELSGTELSFRQNTFFTTQLIGEHTLAKAVRAKWYGAFNILDGYVPDQRRILYSRTANSTSPYLLLVSNTLSQQSGSRIFQNLSDYIYTGGADVTYNVDLFGKRQVIKGGYMFQVKDRLYDAKLFANYLPRDNPALRLLPADKVFASENFGEGAGSQFGFDAIKGNTFRYLANTQMNAGYIQFDNQFFDALRIVWGMRVENYDQLVGSVKKTDPRHSHSKVLDLLPGLNATYKINPQTNLRLSVSQTVIRPELRELSSLNLYDFELNASVQGNPSLKRTKISNFDLRYELYPQAGELFSAGVFYKHFKDPIEQLFSEGIGGASTFSFQNAAQAKSYGAEVEFRKKLDFADALKNFIVQGNAAYITSRVTDIRFQIDRSLQGQSPYLLNLGLMYDLQPKGVTATVLFNQIGERIYLVGDLTGGAGSPDIYEASRPILDFQLTKKFYKNKAELRVNVTDILNRTQYFYQNAGGNMRFQKNEDAYRFTRKFGTTLGLNINYSL